MAVSKTAHGGSNPSSPVYEGMYRLVCSFFLIKVFGMNCKIKVLHIFDVNRKIGYDVMEKYPFIRSESQRKYELKHERTYRKNKFIAVIDYFDWDFSPK